MIIYCLYFSDIGFLSTKKNAALDWTFNILQKYLYGILEMEFSTHDVALIFNAVWSASVNLKLFINQVQACSLQ